MSWLHEQFRLLYDWKTVEPVGCTIGEFGPKNFKKTASQNNCTRSRLLGTGYYGTIHLRSFCEIFWESQAVTAYTPYRAEIAQGRLRSAHQLRTMVIDLGKRANASFAGHGCMLRPCAFILLRAKRYMKNINFSLMRMGRRTIDLTKDPLEIHWILNWWLWCRQLDVTDTNLFCRVHPKTWQQRSGKKIIRILFQQPTKKKRPW